jgi:hypothetical protein
LNDGNAGVLVIQWGDGYYASFKVLAMLQPIAKTAGNGLYSIDPNSKK